MGSDVEKAKSIYSNLFKEEGEIFNQIVDEAKKSAVYTKEEDAEKAVEDFKNKWKNYCIENNIKWFAIELIICIVILKIS